MPQRHLAAFLGLVIGVAQPLTARSAEVSGRVILGIEGVALGDLGPTVVYLEPSSEYLNGPRLEDLRVRQRRASFDPSFLVATVGQAVEMPNDDSIYHNVFSFSRPNDFDLGLYEPGTHRRVIFEHAGVVRLYCSIHESMNGTILVVPSPWHAVVRSNGAYRILGAPPGEYRVHVWNDRLPVISESVRIERESQALRLELAVSPPS